MNLSESASESTYSSCKSQENGVVSTESDRPLKKARFAWEVKGKYYLKNDISDNKSEVSTPDANDAGSSLGTEREKDLNSNVQPNLDVVDDIINQELCTLDSVGKSNPKQQSDTCISQEIINSPQFNDNDEDYIDYQNHSLAFWQQEQLTKCLVENSLNTYYESTRGTPQNLSSDRRIEDEGILMAISTHGLQNNSSSSDYDTDNTSISSPSSIHSEEPLYSNDRLDERLCIHSQNLSNYLITSHSYTNNNEENNIEYDEDNNSNSSIDTKTHYDFLDTAVSFAIQYKGLTSHGADYG